MAKKQSCLEKRVEKLSSNKVSMSLGTLVVDENLRQLIQPLGALNIKVVSPPQGMSDEDIKSAILSHRIIVTKNAKDFIDDASIHEYGIIALEDLGFIDHTQDGTNTTARIVSKAIQKYSLWSKAHGFILILKPSGKHLFRNLTG